MTRHELKEQLQHDAFRDNVDVAVGYVATHRQQMVRWVVIGLAVLLIAGLSYGVYRYQRSQRDQALQAAFQIVDAPVAPEPDGFGKSFTTQQAKDQAAMKALSDVASKYSGTEQGDIAQYYLAGLQVSNNKLPDAERNFKAVAGSNSQVSTLAKVALAQLYLAQHRADDAKNILQGVVSKPGSLVSKDQATVFLASVIKEQDPKHAKQMLESLSGPTQRPAVERAASQVLQETK